MPLLRLELFPIEQRSEFDPLYSTLDTKSRKQAVQMSFYRTFSDIQIPGNLRVIAALE